MYKTIKQEQLKEKVKNMVSDWSPFIHGFVFMHKSAQTALNTAIYLKQFFEWCIESDIIEKDKTSDITENDIAQIKPVHISQYCDALLSGNGCRRNRRSSISVKLEVLRAFWRYLIANKFIDSTYNIIDGIAKWQYREEHGNTEYDRRRRAKTPTDQQVLNLLHNFQNCSTFDKLRNTAIVMAFCGTGVRLSELIGMDISDVDFDQKTISFMKKGNLRDKSTVPIADTALNAIEEYLDYRTGYDNQALFINHNNERISERGVQYLLEKYSNHTITPHMLRHWVGSKLFATTGNIKDAQDQLGHASLETTNSFYVSQDKNRGETVINKII